MFDPTKLTNGELWQACETLRSRGFALAAYGAGDISEGPAALDDVATTPEQYEAFMQEHREAIEDAMCEAVWQFCQNVQLVGDKLEHV